MSARRNEALATETDVAVLDNPQDNNPVSKLERRRRIEDIFEEKRLREELEDY